jgi:SAM-dependent methyltransferase
MPPALINQLRLLRLRAVFRALRIHVKGSVLDMGGRDFFEHVRKDSEITFDTWTSLELERSAAVSDDARYTLVVGDGEHAPFDNGTFDTAVNLQVLEHTLHPIQMLREIHRVLKPGGVGIILIPQTAALHEVPTHYYNFTRYFVEEACKEVGLSVDSITPLGGRWSTHASHMFFFFMEAFRVRGYSGEEYKRSLFFYPLLPFMIVYAVFGIGIGMLFSLGDLTEDPNNLLVIVRKT